MEPEGEVGSEDSASWLDSACKDLLTSNWRSRPLPRRCLLVPLRLTGLPAELLGTLGERLSLGEVKFEFAALLVGVAASTLLPVDTPAFSFVSFCKEFVAQLSSHVTGCLTILPS